jgi:phosphoserine aminotransferase
MSDQLALSPDAHALPAKPEARPARPFFSSGPCAKRPGWSLSALEGALLGRSHRSAEGREKIRDVIDRSHALLGIPADWRVAVVPASDTGAVEMVLWAIAGARGIDVLSFESFSATWAHDLRSVLALDDVRVLEAPYGALPDLEAIDWSRDIVLTWNGTTAGVCVPADIAIPADRAGLVICDATSAAFAMDLPWDRLDVVTWSWQKALGGEAAHGMLALSPRAVARLEAAALRPLPKVFRLTSKGKLNEAIFRGDTINTPSMLCVEDALDSLAWAERVGGLPGLIDRVQANFAVLSNWVERADWIDFLAADPRTRSTTSVCLKIVAPWFAALDQATQAKAAKRIATLVADEGAGFDLGAHRDAPAGLRVWAGATVETADIEALLPWLDWAHEVARTEFAA